MKLSVCIPVYNVEPYIEQGARSLFAQTLTDIEFIFVDDGSSDRSLEIVQAVLDEFPSVRPRVRFVRHDCNRGLAAARRTGMSVASGEWIGHCDADDWVDPEYYENLLSAAEQKGAEMAFGVIRREFADGRMADERLPDVADGVALTRSACPSAAYNAVCNKIFRRDVALASDIEIDEKVSLGEDLMYTCQVVPRCRTVVACRTAVYHYRQGCASITRDRDGARRVADLCAVFPILEKRLTSLDLMDARDRFLRDILLAAIRYQTMDTPTYAAWRRRLNSSLLTDGRHGLGKRGILALADISYPLACWLARKVHSTS